MINLTMQRVPPQPHDEKVSRFLNDVSPKVVLLAAVLFLSTAPALLHITGFNFSTVDIPIDYHMANRLSPSQAAELIYASVAGSFMHTILEWSAIMVAAFTALLAFTHFTITRDVATPIIAVALFSAGSVDAFHTLAADRLINANTPNNDLIPLTWAVSRSFNAIIPPLALLGVLFVRRYGSEAQGRQNPYFVVVASLLLGAIAYGIIQYCATGTNLPQTTFPHSLITRPWDVLPLVVYAICGLILYPLFRKKMDSYFFDALWISVIPNFATQLHMTFGSTLLFDSHFNAAHFLKIIAYLVPCIGLILDYIATYHGTLNSGNNSMGRSVGSSSSHTDIEPFAVAASNDREAPFHTTAS